MSKVLLTFSFLLVTELTFAASKIVGGTDVPSNSPFSKSVVALLSEYQSDLKVTCTGTLVSPRVVITAAHCLRSIISPNIFVSMGNNPLTNNEKVRVSDLLYFDPQFWGTMDSFNDIAVLLIEKEFNSYEVAEISSQDALKINQPVIQLGYGLQSFDPSENDTQYPRYGKLQALIGYSIVQEISEQKIVTTCDKDHGVMGGDSGGPLLTQKGSRLSLHGVLSQGGPAFGDSGESQRAYYTSPYYFISWINSTLPTEFQIKSPYDLHDQFPTSLIKLVSFKDFPEFNRSQCRNFRKGWEIDDEQICWPATKASCILFEQTEVPGEVFWSDQYSKCELRP